MPGFRFTLTHEILGTQEISEPDGWKGSKIILERDKDFFSLIEYYQGAAGGAFIFYGDNGTENGGIDFIREVEQTYGFDSIIEVNVEYTSNGLTYNTLFNGQLDLSGKTEMPNNRMQVPIIRNDFWSKFINRFDTPVNLSSTTDIDGNAVDPVTPININLTSQKIRYTGQYTAKDMAHYDGDGDGIVIEMDFDNVVVDDLKKFTLPRVVFGSSTSFSSMPGLFEAPWNGDFTFEIRIEAGSLPAEFGFSDPVDEPAIYIGLVNQTSLTSYTRLSRTTTNNGGNILQIFTTTKTFTLSKGQQITLFGKIGSTAGTFNVFGSRLPSWKSDVNAATTANITLSGTQTVDDIALIIGDRCLVKDQADQRENGIYTVAAGAWARSTNADTSAELQDAKLLVSAGTTNGGIYFIQASPDIEIGETPITFEANFYDDLKIADYPGTSTPDTHINVTADTTFPNTECEGYLIHDVFSGIIARIGLGDNRFYSEYLGSTFTTTRSYDTDGCGSTFAIMKGLHLKGYTLTEKPFELSLNDLWSGLNPILNLGLGYEDIDNVQCIRCEEKGHFVSDDACIDIPNIPQPESSYDKNYIFKTIKCGYEKWESESIYGLDDAQTKKSVVTPLKNSGIELNIESSIMAASTAIEAARRATVQKTSDYRLDNNIFIISIRHENTSPVGFYPELDENFTSITNITNSSTRYNFIITPIRNFLRWAPFIGGGLQNNLTQYYKPLKGEGNADLVTDYDCSTGSECLAVLCGSVGETDPILIGSITDYYFLPIAFKITFPLSYEDLTTILDERKKGINISQTTDGFTLFKTSKLEFDLIKGEATLTAWPKTFFNVVTTQDIPTMPGCAIRVSDGGGTISPGIETCYRLTEDGLTRITEDGNNRITENC